MRDKRGAYKIWRGDLKGRDPLEDVSIDERIIPKSIF